MKKLFHAKTSFLLKKIFNNLTWDFYNKSEFVYLTFDDGPTPDVTDKVLEILKKYNVKGTFFCRGTNVQLYPDLYRRVISEGHAVGNHSYSHLKGWYTRNRDYYNDIDLARQYIDSDLFRPPHGKINFHQIRHIIKSYKIIMWDIMSFDFDPGTSVDECIDNVLRNVRHGSIITFHDSPKAAEKVLNALPVVIETLLEKHYKLTQTIAEGLSETMAS